MVINKGWLLLLLLSCENLITVSLGSGNFGDVNYLFMDDICGENKEIPRNAFSLAKIYKLRDKIYREKTQTSEKWIY